MWKRFLIEVIAKYESKVCLILRKIRPPEFESALASSSILRSSSVVQQKVNYLFVLYDDYLLFSIDAICHLKLKTI